MSQDAGFGPTESPVRRGRRDPKIARELAMEMSFDAGTGPEDDYRTVPEEDDVTEAQYLGLSEGAVITVKHSISYRTATGAEAWSTYGATDRILEGEDEEAAFTRVGDIVNTRCLDLAADMDERVSAMAKAQHTRPITAQRR